MAVHDYAWQHSSPPFSGTGGVFQYLTPKAAPLLSALIIVDYQNIHLTAHDKWGQGAPTHESLIHPLHYGRQVIGHRNYSKKRQGVCSDPAQLAGVVAYRGLPSNNFDSTAYRRSMAQRSEWTRDRSVEVKYRPLRYLQGQPREKGIDVLIALHLVRAAQSGQYDLVILASHDTDLEPAVDEAAALAPRCAVLSRQRAGRAPSGFAHPEGSGTPSWGSLSSAARWIVGTTPDGPGPAS